MVLVVTLWMYTLGVCKLVVIKVVCSNVIVRGNIKKQSERQLSDKDLQVMSSNPGAGKYFSSTSPLNRVGNIDE